MKFVDTFFFFKTRDSKFLETLLYVFFKSIRIIYLYIYSTKLNLGYIYFKSYPKFDYLLLKFHSWYDL